MSGSFVLSDYLCILWIHMRDADIGALVIRVACSSQLLI
jgi:hypothetical protein